LSIARLRRGANDLRVERALWRRVRERCSFRESGLAMLRILIAVAAVLSGAACGNDLTLDRFPATGPHPPAEFAECAKGWIFEFHGVDLLSWNYDLADLNPARRSLPLGFDRLEAWEEWLQAGDPESAARILNPREAPPDCDGCNEWVETLAPGDPQRASRLAPLVWGLSMTGRSAAHAAQRPLFPNAVIASRPTG
jgi:hypothetical protein